MSFTLQPRIRTTQGHKRPPLTAGLSRGGGLVIGGFVSGWAGHYSERVLGGAGVYSLRYRSGRWQIKNTQHSSWNLTHRPFSCDGNRKSLSKLPLKTTEGEEKEETEEMAASLAAAKDISIDAVVVAVLSDLGGINKRTKSGTKGFSSLRRYKCI